MLVLGKLGRWCLPCTVYNGLMFRALIETIHISWYQIKLYSNILVVYQMYVFYTNLVHQSESENIWANLPVDGSLNSTERKVPPVCTKRGVKHVKEKWHNFKIAKEKCAKPQYKIVYCLEEEMTPCSDRRPRVTPSQIDFRNNSRLTQMHSFPGRRNLT